MIKLNIQLFAADLEGGMNPTNFNMMIADYHAQLPYVDRAFVNNKDALVTLKALAGAPTISDNTRSIIQVLTNAISQTTDYFDSVRGWTNNVVDVIHSIFGGSVPVDNINRSINRETLDQIDESFESGYVGVRNLSDIEEFISSILTDVIPTLRNALEIITDDVNSANGSLPGEVHAALGETISTNNSEIIDGYTKAATYLTEQVDAFKNEISKFITDAAASAKGTEK